MIAVTPGAAYSDIDGLACAVAYAELLRAQKHEAVALLPGRFNNTITESVRSWNPQFANSAPQNAKLVLVDVSEPTFISQWRDLDNVIEIYDHHAGAESFWSQKIGDSAHIEFIGAASTLIWEQFRKHDRANKISQTSARLLYTAILSNTLNFNAELTSPRDHAAFNLLAPLAHLPVNWPELYYAEIEHEIWSNLARAVTDDTKVVGLSRPQRTVAIGQLELWDASQLSNHQATIRESLTKFGHPWFLNGISISEGKNYLYCEDPQLKKLLTTSIRAQFSEDWGTTNRLWLRKEILKGINS